MARGKKTGGKDFQPGHSVGRPRKPEDLAKAFALTKTQAEGFLTKFMRMDIEELEAVLKDKKKPVIEHIIGRVCLMAIKNGDHARLDFVLNRLIGKVKESVEHTITPKIIHNLDGGGAKLIMEGEEDGEEEG